MMSGLVTKILYQKRKFVFGWFVGIFALTLFMILMYPSLHKSDLGQLFESLSPALQKVAGGSDSFSTLQKYISGELFALRLPLLFIVMSIILFNTLAVGDERRGILMTQLCLPISREGLLAKKLLAASIILVIVAIGAFLGTVVGAAAIHESVDLVQVIRHTLGCLLVAFDFGMIVFVLGGGFGWKGSATAVATAIAFTSYLISSLAAIATVLVPYEKLSLFHYYQNPSPVSLQHLTLLTGVAVVAIIAGLLAFPRRDID